MTYTLRILTAESRDLVVEALRAEAAKRTRVAQGAALAVAEDRAAKRDVRSASVRVTALLAEAGRLDQLATELAAAQDVPVVEVPRIEDPPTLTPREAVAALTLGTIPDEDLDALIATADDDGLSAAAHAAMRTAEDFEAELLDPDGSDVDTGATVEDDDEPDATDTDALEEGLKP